MPTKGFVGSAAVVALLTLSSRVLGVVREIAFGYYLGTSEILSAFRIAFQVPNLTRRLFGEGALSSAVIPVLTETLRDSGDEASRRFVGSIISLLMAVLGCGLIGAELVIAVWRAFQDDLTLELTAVMLPYAAMICTVAVVSGVLNVRGHFALPAAAPIVLNVFNIAALVAGVHYLGMTDVPLIYLVSLSVLAAGLLQLVAMLLAMRWLSFSPILNTAWRGPQVRRVIGLMAPMALGLSAVQVNTLMDNVIAYLFIFGDGERDGPAVLGFAQVLYQLPLGVFGISIATAIFPLLSARAAADDHPGLADAVQRGVRLALFIALPSTVGLIFIADPLVTMLFERGEFDAADTERVTGTLVFYTLGLAAYFAQHIVVRTFYSLNDSATPARTAGLMVMVNVALNLVLVQWLQERGLALSTAVCATAQVIWLAAALRRKLPQIKWREVARGAAVMALASGMMAGGLVLLDRLMAAHLEVTSYVGTIVIAGAILYAAFARILRIAELDTALSRVRRRA